MTILTFPADCARILPSVKSGPRVRARCVEQVSKTPIIGALVCEGTDLPTLTTALASILGVFAFVGAV